MCVGFAFRHWPFLGSKPSSLADYVNKPTVHRKTPTDNAQIIFLCLCWLAGAGFLFVYVCVCTSHVQICANALARNLRECMSVGMCCCCYCWCCIVVTGCSSYAVSTYIMRACVAEGIGMIPVWSELCRLMSDSCFGTEVDKCIFWWLFWTPRWAGCTEHSGRPVFIECYFILRKWDSFIYYYWFSVRFTNNVIFHIAIFCRGVRLKKWISSVLVEFMENILHCYDAWTREKTYHRWFLENNASHYEHRVRLQF